MKCVASVFASHRQPRVGTARQPAAWHGTMLAPLAAKLRGLLDQLKTGLRHESRNAQALTSGFCGGAFFQGNLAGVQRRGAGPRALI